MATTAVERRYTLLPVDVRAGGHNPKIGGYASVFGKASRNLGGFIEQVMPPFFNKSRGDGWPGVMARWNHEDNLLVGTTDAGTLRLSVDEIGLDYEVEPPHARADLVELVQRGDIRKSSFAFRVYSEGDEWGLSEQGYPLRSLLSGQLVDVAPVNSPAYEDTSAGMRAAVDADADPELAAQLRRLGIGPEAAYASLAARKSADVAEVRSLAKEDGLRAFFVRTDNKGPAKPKAKRLLGAAATANLLARQEDPWV